MQIQQAIHWASQQLTQSDSAKLDAELLLAHCLNQSRTYLFTWPEKSFDDIQLENFKNLIVRRKQGEPVAYLLGHQGFWSLDLEVEPSTLIPRPETELLVDLSLERCDSKDEKRVLDLGTGTGAIALALASECPNWQVTAVDVKEEAVTLAKRNIQQLKLKNVECFQSNWFENISGQFDLIVSNPPYIRDSDPHLDQGDVRFEPRSALTSGEDGFDDIRKIVQQAPEFLTPGGLLMVEHGYDQGETAREIFSSRLENVETVKDLGDRDRVTLGFA